MSDRDNEYGEFLDIWKKAKETVRHKGNLYRSLVQQLAQEDTYPISV